MIWHSALLSIEGTTNYNGDFYAIDPNLFSPGKVKVISLDSGKIFTEGRLNNDLLDKSFGYEKN